VRAYDLGTEKQSRPGSMQPPERELWNTLLMRERDARARDVYLTHTVGPDKSSDLSLQTRGNAF
jgi:hypothetical protein